MAREKGELPISNSFEVHKAGPIDARNIIKSKDLLTEMSTWTTSTGFFNAYIGMCVRVEGGGSYVLKNFPITDIDNWEDESVGVSMEDILSTDNISKISNRLKEHEIRNKINIISDPYFKYGAYMGEKSVYPKLINGTINQKTNFDSSTGVMTIESTQNTRKAFHIMASFPTGWADMFEVKEGSKITLGCYVKYEAANIETATLEQWGSFYYNNVGVSTIPYTPLADEQPSDTTPLDDYVWYQRTITVTQNAGQSLINDELLFSLVFWRLTDPDANSDNPSKIHIKQPCIIVNAMGDEHGFYETYRGDLLISNEYIKTNELEVDTFSFKKLQSVGDELDITGVTNIDARYIGANMLSLKDNETFPTDGNYIGYESTELALSEYGKISYIANRQFTLSEWEALSEDEKKNIGMADIISETAVPMFTPVYTQTEWLAMSEEERAKIDVADVVEG